MTDDQRIDERVDVAVERDLLDRIDHRVDAPFAVAQRVGAHRIPEGLVAAVGLLVGQYHAVVHAQHLLGDRLADVHVRIGDFARADERDELRGVGRRERELGRDAVAVAEPVAVRCGAVLVVETQVADPIDVHAPGHAGRGRAQGIAGRVDVQLAVEHRRGQAAGVEADLVGLAAIDREAVHQEIVVERGAARTERSGEAHVEQVDEMVVEVHVAVHAARELGDGEAVLDARDVAGADHLAREGGAEAVVEVGRRLGDHGRQVGLSGERRGVHVVEDESEVALEPFVAESGADVRQVELHLRVGAAPVGVVLLGVVLRTAADRFAQDRQRGVVARGDDHLVDAELHGLQGEVHLVECSGGDRLRGGGVTHDRGLDAGRGVARLERVDALFVGGDSRRGAGEDDAGELQGMSVGGVGDPAAHARGLGCGTECVQQGCCEEDDPAEHHKGKCNQKVPIRRK